MNTWFMMFAVGWFLSNFGALGIGAIGVTALAYAFKGTRAAVGVGVIAIALLFGMKAVMSTKATHDVASAKAQAEAKKRAARKRWNAPAEKALDAASKNAMSHLGAAGGGVGGGMGGGFGGGSTPVNIPHAPTHSGGGGIQFVPRVEAAGPPSISTRTMAAVAASPPAAAAPATAFGQPVNHQASDDDSQPVSRDMVKNLVGAANLKAAASQAANANASASTNAAQPANAGKAKPSNTPAPLAGGGGNQPATSHTSGITPSVGRQAQVTGKSLADQAKAAAIQVVPPQKTDTASSTANTAQPAVTTIGGFGQPNAKPTSPSTPPSGDTAPASLPQTRSMNHAQAMPQPGDASTVGDTAAATPHKQQRYKPHYQVTDPEKLAQIQMNREMQAAMPYSPSHGSGFGGDQPAASNAASHRTHHYASTDPNGIDRHGNPVHPNGIINPLSPMPGVQPGAIGNPGVQHGPTTQHPGGYQQPMGGQHPGFNPMHNGGMGMPQMPMGQPSFGGGFGPMHSGQAATHATHGGGHR